MGGAYNKSEDGGITVDKQRRVDVFSIDFNTTIKKTGTYLVGEYSYISVDVPETYSQQYGNKQQGFFLDIVQPILKRKRQNQLTRSLNSEPKIKVKDTTRLFSEKSMVLNSSFPPFTFKTLNAILKI